MVGRSFSNFDIVEQLGSGGMGVVYRAIDRKLGRSVALKFLSSDYRVEGEARERFLREARAASALDHPNVGTIHSIEETPEGDLCIVMAYYEGETASERLTRGPVPLLDALRIARDVADGLADAHSHGIVHRDVKPSNIMLTRGGVKVVDFGLAKFTEGDPALTETAAVLGTAAYMSPEQAKGQPAGARSDIWSLGAVLYEMITGRRPFRGGSTYALLHSVVNDKPERPGTGLPQVDRVVLKALQKDPSDRYESMEEFAVELRKVAALVEAQSSDLTVGVSSRSIRFWSVPSRWRTWWVVAAALALVLLSLAMIPAIRNRVLSFTMPGRGGRQPATVAIVPFVSTEDPATSALGAGFAESLSARIASLERYAQSVVIIPSAEVVSRNIRDGDEARRLLGASLAVTGSLRRVGSRGLRLDLEVRDARSGDSMRRSVEDATGDSGALEDRAAAELCAVLDIRVDPEVIAASKVRGVSTGSAYESYLRGLGYLQRWDKPDNLEHAITAFSEALRADAGFAPAYVGMAETSRTRFRTDKDPANIQHALNYSQQAVRLGPRLADAHVVMGRVYQDMAQRDLAVLEFQRALEIDPKNIAAIVGMGRGFEDLGRTADAENAYRRAIALNPYAWSTYNNLASFFIRQGRFADAEAQFRRALVLTPDNPALYSNLGIVLNRQQRTAEAAAMFRKSLELGPGYQAYLNLGNIYYRDNRFRQAAEAYDKALQLNSRDFRVWGTKAQALRLSGAAANDVRQAYARAIALGEESLQLNPGQARTLSLLAIYYACSGNRSAAVDRVQQALTRTSLDREVLIDAATAYQVLGQHEQAARWAKSALAQGYPWDEFKNDPDLEPLVTSGVVKGPG